MLYYKSINLRDLNWHLSRRAIDMKSKTTEVGALKSRTNGVNDFHNAGVLRISTECSAVSGVSLALRSPSSTSIRYVANQVNTRAFHQNTQSSTIYNVPNRDSNRICLVVQILCFGTPGRPPKPQRIWLATLISTFSSSAKLHTRPGFF